MKSANLNILKYNFISKWFRDFGLLASTIALTLFIYGSQAFASLSITVGRPAPTQAEFESPGFREKEVTHQAYQSMFTLDGRSRVENHPYIHHVSHWNTHFNSEYGNFYTLALRDGTEIVLSNLFPAIEDKYFPEKGISIHFSLTPLGDASALGTVRVLKDANGGRELIGEFAIYMLDVRGRDLSKVGRRIDPVSSCVDALGKKT